MGVGQVPADWRHQRVLLRAKLEPSSSRPALQFLDIEALDTREYLRGQLARILAFYDVDDLDVATVRGADRRITRWIAKWAYEAWDHEGARIFAGIRYLSRLNTDWECWAVFHDVGLAEIEREPITRQNQTLLSVARLFKLTIH